MYPHEAMVHVSAAEVEVVHAFEGLVTNTRARQDGCSGGQ